MSDNISIENILNYIRKFAIKHNNYEQFRKSIEENYSQKIRQKIILLMSRAPKYVLDGQRYSTYSIKVKVGDSLIDISPNLSEEEINFIFNLPYSEFNE